MCVSVCLLNLHTGLPASHCTSSFCLLLLCGGVFSDCDCNWKRQTEIAEIPLIQAGILQFTELVNWQSLFFSQTDLSLLFITAWQICLCVCVRLKESVCHLLTQKFSSFSSSCVISTLSLSFTHTLLTDQQHCGWQPLSTCSSVSFSGSLFFFFNLLYLNDI